MSFLADYLEARAATRPPGHVSEGGGWSWLRGGRKRAGVYVDLDSALGNTALLAAVTIIPAAIASLPFKVFDRKTREEIVGDHRLARILEEPNPEMTPFSFWAAGYFNKLRGGNLACEIELDNGGRSKYLWPLPVHGTRAERVYKRPGGGLTTDRLDATPEDRRRGGTVQIVVNETTRLPSRASFVVPDFINSNGIWARSRIFTADEAIGIGLGRQRYTSSTFDTSAVPPIAIKRPKEATPLNRRAARARLLAWEADHGGPWKAGRVALLQEGEELETIGWSPEEAAMIETANFSVLDVARILHMPPHLLAHLVDATFSNVEHQDLTFLKITLGPHIKATEQEVRRKLAGGDRGVYAEHVLEGLLRGDSEARGKLYTALWQIGAMTGNEIRRRENLPPRPDGDRTYTPLNYTPDQGSAGDLRSLALSRALAPAGGAWIAPRQPWDDLLPEPRRAPAIIRGAAVESRAAIETRSVESRRRLRTAFRELLEGGMSRVVTAEVQAVRRMLDSASFIDELADFYREHQARAERIVGPILSTIAAAVAVPAADEVGVAIDGIQPVLDQEAARYRASWAAGYVRRSEFKLRDLANKNPEGVAAALAARLDLWEAGRAAKDTRFELVRLDSTTAKTVYRAAGITQTRWVFHGGDCRICPALDGRTITIGEAYLSRGDKVESGDPDVPDLEVKRLIKGPPAHGGCECSEVAAT